MKKIWSLITLSVAICLTSCSSTESQGSGALPILESPARQAAWGAPVRTAETNGYRLTYKNPKFQLERVVVIGSSKMLASLTYPPNIKGEKMVNGELKAVSIPQAWKKATVAGESVGYYQDSLPSGADAAQFRTSSFHRKDAQGNTGYYFVIIDGGEAQAKQWLGELKMQK